MWRRRFWYQVRSRSNLLLAELVAELADQGAKVGVSIEAPSDLTEGVDDRGVISTAEGAGNGGEGEVGQLPGQVHGELPDAVDLGRARGGDEPLQRNAGALCEELRDSLDARARGGGLDRRRQGAVHQLGDEGVARERGEREHPRHCSLE